MRPAVIIFIAAFAAILSSLYARDINLDSIYVSRESPDYSRLVTKKIGMYEETGSVVIDRNVIFSHWVDGFSVVYIKETPGVNIIYTYNRTNLKRREIGRFPGTVISSRLSSHGKYLFIKRLLVSAENIPEGETLFVNLSSRRKRSIPSRSPFLDFSITPSGNAVLYENRRGIVEFFPESGVSRVIAELSRYVDVVRGENPTVAILSPNRKKLLCVNGSGGMYRGKILTTGKPLYVSGITSVSEIGWLDNKTVFFRKGSPGYFSVCLFDVSTGKLRVLATQSMNTGINYSPFPKMLSFQKDQLIHFYNVRTGTLYRTALEGDDVLFSHDGSRFTSIYRKRLILSSIATVLKKEQALKNRAGDIGRLYRELLSQKKYWLNEYSHFYLKRKLNLYNRISGRE